MTSEFEYFLADSIDTPFIFPSIALLFIDNASRKVERIVIFSWKILSHSIKILYIWFCWEYGDGTVMEVGKGFFFFAILSWREVIGKIVVKKYLKKEMMEGIA